MIVTVNGTEVDVIKSSVNLNFQNNELNEIKNRNLSNTRLRFPKTPRNMDAFEYLGAQGSASRVPYSIVPCQIKDGALVQIKGVLKITSITEDSFEGILKEEAGDIFDLIKDKSLKDLDFSDINHYLNNTTYASSVGNTDTYTYPVGNYGEGVNTVDNESPTGDGEYVYPVGEEEEGTININRQSPALFKKYIWDKIFSEAGAYYFGDFFLGSNFKNEVIGMYKGQLDVGKALKQGVLQGQNIKYTSYQPTYDLNTTFLPLNGTGTHIDDRIKVYEDGRIEVLEKCKIRLVHDFKSTARVMTYGTVTGGISSTFDIKENGISVYSHSDTDTYSLNLSVQVWTAEVEHNAVFYALAEKGDVYTFETTSSATSDTMNSNGVTIINWGDSNTLEILEPYIDFSDLIGDISQTKFIKDIIGSNGLMFKRDNPILFNDALTREDLFYRFVNMEDLLNDRTNAEDWTSKKNMTKVSKPSIGSYGLNNKLSYKYKEDVTPFLDYTHISTNENQKAENKLYTSIYEVSSINGSFMGVETVNNNLFELVRNEEFEGTAGAQYLAGFNEFYKSKESKTITSKVRLHYKNYNIIDGNGAEVSISGMANYLTNDKVQMEFYYNRYFKAFSRIIDEPVKDTMSIYLSPLDVQLLDFFKLKYFSQDGRYYYLNKVSKFTEGINTLCELVAVIGNEQNDYETEDYEYNNYVINNYTI